MYDVLIVDDEEEIRAGIIEKVDFEGNGLRVIGEAENGIEALDRMETQIPDIIITDIKMPFMDGITLAKKIREKYKTIKIIFLTGFDEFDYAHKAIKLDVAEYVLKPITSKELTNILGKVKETIDEENRQIRNLKELKKYYNRSLPLLREKFLGLLITNRLYKKDVLRKAKEYELEIDGQGFYLAVISLDSNISGFYMPEDKELLKFAVLNTAEEILKDHIKDDFYIFLHNEEIIILLMTDKDEKEPFTIKIYNILEEIRTLVEQYLRLTVTIGLSDYYNDVTDSSQAFKNAKSALEYQIILGHNQVICIEDIEPGLKSTLEFDELKERQLINLLKVGTMDEINNYFNNLFEKIGEEVTHIKNFQIYLLEILTTILKVAKDLDTDFDTIFGNDYNLFHEIYAFKDLNKVKDWLIYISTTLKGYISNDRKDVCKLIVEKAKEYVKDHYKDNELTINKVCENLFISPSYFSTIFKKETKVTFVNYLTDMRMEIAKGLLRSTALKTYKISEMVGYSEPNYFSYSFKKNVGISPSKYRNSMVNCS